MMNFTYALNLIAIIVHVIHVFYAFFRCQMAEVLSRQIREPLYNFKELVIFAHPILVFVLGCNRIAGVTVKDEAFRFVEVWLT
jgi:hypothetical protein